LALPADGGVICVVELRHKSIFKEEFSSLSSFSSLWKDEVHHQLLAKGALLIKDAQSLDRIKYSAFIFSLVALRMRL
jgi:hypothetical protein